MNLAIVAFVFFFFFKKKIILESHQKDGKVHKGPHER